MYITEKDFLSTYKDKKAGKRALKKINIPIKLNSEIAKIVSYVTFDGHLAGDFGQLFLSSKDKKLLKKFSKLISKRFGLKGKIEKCTDGFGLSYKYRVFSRSLGRIIYLAGAPKGNKSITLFDVPSWIKKNRKYSKEYLKVAFDCEGTISRDPNGYPRLRFKIVKNKDFLYNGIKFMKSIKEMLGFFGIETTEIWTIKGSNVSENGIGICFAVKKRSFEEFSKDINFTIKMKYNRLKDILDATRCGTG
jgi:hypothetical protein